MDTTNSLPIVIYTKNNCQPCRLTKAWLTSHGLRYIEHNVEDDPDAFERVKAMGYQGVPVVVVPFDWPTPGEHWQGLRPDKLQALIG